MPSVCPRISAPSQPTRGVQVGNYVLLQELGQGGSARVYLAEHCSFKTRVALKLLKPAGASQEQIRHLQFEAHLLTTLSHRHIVQALDFGWDDGIPYLAMEYAPGGSLQLPFTQKDHRPLSVLLPAVLQTASALQYLHNHQLIHRDVKPENLLLGPDNDVWLADFGIATTISSMRCRREREREVRGTARYMAPEQIQGHPLPASDQYALAVMVYEWLCGYPPFDGSALGVCVRHMKTPPPRLRYRVPSISFAVERVVLKALAKDPHKRFGHVLEFASALKQASLSERYYSNTPMGAASVITGFDNSSSYVSGSKRAYLFEHEYAVDPVNITLGKYGTI